MRENHILVTSLEEYEPNREFVGRNFNAGEVIQLVLKSVTTRQWLPFTYVQMVMMHEYVPLKTHLHLCTNNLDKTSSLQADEPFQGFLGSQK